ncbi:hypothetical protein BJAS_P3477 [Bathymodiolus japonicus methanotrophic gill symbiont]|uniref:hypothetical protein n=1 Tax=Bathymodiolus japonicus methanotrophic gill symbiont TaxID=113269 RepID=UPI001B4454A9|nr:hypothetical protein [Bathymodiolus japonicus methanotrophic gill symbiont]GFO72940.1 hypothetical protein BJAS_P3477 [Bathymodiolus japonicus methanotrophic gill symbiont]
MNRIFLSLIAILIPLISNASPRFLDSDMTSNVSHLGQRNLSLVTGRFLTQDIKKQYASHYNYGNGLVIAHSDPKGNVFDFAEFSERLGDALTAMGEKDAVKIKEKIIKLMPDRFSKELTTVDDIVSQPVWQNPKPSQDESFYDGYARDSGAESDDSNKKHTSYEDFDANEEFKKREKAKYREHDIDTISITPDGIRDSTITDKNARDLNSGIGTEVKVAIAAVIASVVGVASYGIYVLVTDDHGKNGHDIPPCRHTNCENRK